MTCSNFLEAVVEHSVPAQKEAFHLTHQRIVIGLIPNDSVNSIDEYKYKETGQMADIYSNQGRG